MAVREAIFLSSYFDAGTNKHNDVHIAPWVLPLHHSNSNQPTTISRFTDFGDHTLFTRACGVCDRNTFIINIDRRIT